ncbi:MAG: hypothetical protein K5989_02595 [Lachnospiraceae bacterium]|nr:hypothetical protein [Lachnospiraceae bacterium]
MGVRSKINKAVLIMAMALMAFLVVFFLLINRSRSREESQNFSPAQEVLQRDLDIRYPPSPKEVVIYYSELSQCMYDSTTTEEDVEALARQSRRLFDDELYARQTDEEYIRSLKLEVAAFAEKQRKIASFTTSSAGDVVYDNTDKGELATLYCVYTMREGALTYTDTEQFILRRDADRHWKILGWQKAGKNGEKNVNELKAGSPASN